MRVAPIIELTTAQRKALTGLVLEQAKGRRTEVRVAMRAKIVLAARPGAWRIERSLRHSGSRERPWVTVG